MDSLGLSVVAARRNRPRRAALVWLLLNGLLWSIGNGLTSGTLINYLAIDLGAKGRQLSYILAAPTLVGLLRLAAPWLIGWCRGPRPTCLRFYLASYLLVLGLPLIGLPQLTPRWLALPLLIGLLCTHQLLEYIAQVAQWSWMAELVPRRLRGRFFSRRQLGQLLVLIPTLLASGYFSDWWQEGIGRDHPEWKLVGYAVPNAVGALCLLASLLPLLKISTAVSTDAAEERLPLAVGELISPLRDRSFRRLLTFGCWFSTANGLTQSPQYLYPRVVLKLSTFVASAMVLVMRLGQAAHCLWIGPLSDRIGNRPILLISQLAVGTAPLFFLWATPAQPNWIWGAWLCWTFYAGQNVCLYNLILKLASPGRSAAYIATYFAVTAVFYSASTLLGGYLFDRAADWGQLSLGAWNLDRYQVAFVISWITRTLAVLLLWRVEEPRRSA